MAALLPFVSSNAKDVTCHDGRNSIVVLFENDVHCAVNGYCSLAGLRDAVSDTAYAAVVSSGDFLQSGAAGAVSRGQYIFDIMNSVGYDAVGIGNHEFDFGLDNMIRLFKMAEFPVVCSNYDFADTELKDIVKPYLVLKRQGVRIGVFALCPPLEGLVSRKNYGPLKFLDPVEVTDRMVDVLRNREKCDVVICLSHLGWEVSDYPDNELIKRTSGIDLILGGHSHTYLETLGYETDKTGRQVPVDHEGKHAVFVGKIQLKLEKK